MSRVEPPVLDRTPFTAAEFRQIAEWAPVGDDTLFSAGEFSAEARAFVAKRFGFSDVRDFEALPLTYFLKALAEYLEFVNEQLIETAHLFQRVMEGAEVLDNANVALMLGGFSDDSVNGDAE